MAKDPNKSRAKNVSTNAHPNLEEEVRRRAYELYEERGREDGRDIDDWVRAQAEVTGTAVQTRAT